MSKNRQLHKARRDKFDEFYTEFSDIEKEINAYIEYNPNVFNGKTILLPCDDPEWSNFTKYFAQNFERFGLKKLISTSYATASKSDFSLFQTSLFELESPIFDSEKSSKNGKIFILESDSDNSGKVDIYDLKWNYIEGDGDFRSPEVIELREEADIIITNPPFSLFKEFINWIYEGGKSFIIIGNENDVSTQHIFPLIKSGVLWLGKNSGDMSFKVPNDSESKTSRSWVDNNGQKWRSMGNICWFTNIELGRRHTFLQLMTMEDNLKYNKPLINLLRSKYGASNYPKISNYDAIEVPRYDAIPIDYNDVMAVPITFLKNHNPNQFSILGHTHSGDKSIEVQNIRLDDKKRHRGYINGKQIYARVLIRKVGTNDGEN